MRNDAAYFMEERESTRRFHAHRASLRAQRLNLRPPS